MNADFIEKLTKMFVRVPEIKSNVKKILDISGKVEAAEKASNEMKEEIEIIKAENQNLRTRINEIERYSRKRNV